MISDDLLVGLIAAVAAIIAAVVPLFLAKLNQTRQEVKKIKMEKYDDLLKSLTTFINSPEAQGSCLEFVTAYNRSSSYASTQVLNACNEFCKALEDATFVRHTILTPGLIVSPKTSLIDTINQNIEKVNEIFKAIRKDIGPGSIFSSRREFDFHVYFAENL